MNLAVSKKFILPLDSEPLLVILIVCFGTTFWVNNLPATLIDIPDKNEGIILFLVFIL